VTITDNPRTTLFVVPDLDKVHDHWSPVLCRDHTPPSAAEVSAAARWVAEDSEDAARELVCVCMSPERGIDVVRAVKAAA